MLNYVKEYVKKEMASFFTNEWKTFDLLNESPQSSFVVFLCHVCGVFTFRYP